MVPFRFQLHVAAVLVAIAGPAHAGESYDNCTGFIDTLPATVSVQGTWCLRKDLGTAMTHGNAITVAGNNITIDCNDFKLGGLAAGDGSGATGIYALERQNITVRHCSIRGFRFGIHLNEGGGHLVEDNRLDQNLHAGIAVHGDHNRVQRNRVLDTGGATGFTANYGIVAAADVIDNTVAGVFATGGADTFPYGIRVSGRGHEVRGNVVRGLAASGGGYARGIFEDDALNGETRFSGNHVSASATTTGAGITGEAPGTFCTDNTVVRFSIAYSGCEAASGNAGLP